MRKYLTPTLTFLSFSFIFLETSAFAGKVKSSSDSESTEDVIFDPSDPYSVTTTSSALDSELESESLSSSQYSSSEDDDAEDDDFESTEILSPKPQKVKKNTAQRSKGYNAKFKKLTGFTSAGAYLKDEDDTSIKTPEIGHAQSYENHGSPADTRKNNLAVISKPANGKMKIADYRYEDDDVDSNRFIVKTGTCIATYSIQQLANPSDEETALTPAVVIDSTMKSSRTPAGLKKSIIRAVSPVRKALMKKLQEKDPDAFYTTDQYTDKIRRKLKKYERDGIKVSSVKVYKFSDQSRSRRGKSDRDETEE